MGNINGKFADQNSYVLTGQIQTSNNNQASLNAILTETDTVRGTNVVLQPGGLVATLANPVPDAITAVQGTVGAALGNIGQAGTPSQEPGGGGNPCFTGSTLISTPNGDRPISDIMPGEIVWGFNDRLGDRCEQKITDKWIHLVDRYTLIEFENGATGVTDNHKYWIKDGYVPISDLDAVWHWDDVWAPRKIITRRTIHAPTLVYNITVENTHNYIANGDAVSNLKPVEGGGGGSGV